MSEVNEFEIVDYLAQARERVTDQFKNKEVFDRYIQLLIFGQEQLQLTFKDLMQNRSLDTAVGVQLDVIGAIVGLERGFLPSSVWNNSYFGFLDDPEALPMSSLEDPSQGGIFFDLANQTEGNVRWDDPTYRLFIKAKIFANTSNGTPEELITATKAILDVEYVDLIELGNARLMIGFNRILNPVEKYIVQGLGDQEGLLPIPIGVGVDFVEADETEFFGFEETPGALGFASFETMAAEGPGYGEGYGEYYGGNGIGYGEGYGEGYGGGSGTTVVLVGGGYFASLF